jgi:predicted MFS family arabinose efflux permease/HAMP domain-containing protein
MLLRSWLAFSIVIAIVQVVLGLLAILQHNAVFSDLLRQRISVIAQTTATSFKPIVDLGLPISMIRTGNAIIARPLKMDTEIRAVHAINPSGYIVYTTDGSRPKSVPREVMQAMEMSDSIKWSTETSEDIFSGFNVVGRDGSVSGSVVVVYPKDRLAAASRTILAETIRTALAIWTVFSALSYLLLRLLLAAPQRTIASLDVDSRGESGAESSMGLDVKSPAKSRFWPGLFGQEIAQLRQNLGAAAKRFDEASRALGGVTATGPEMHGEEFQRGDGAKKDDLQIASSSTRSLARQIASHLAPLAAVFILSSALILGIVILRNVNQSIEPELAARTNLIGNVVSDDVQRALGTGVPLENLVGAESFFGDMLKQLPEVAYVAVATGRVILEAGKRIDPYLAPPRERKDVRSHPIFHEGKEIAYVVIDIDPTFISKKFFDVFLDMGVVVLAAVLIAFEVMVLMTSRSLTAALDRLQRLAAMQASGDFSKRVTVAARNAVDRASKVLTERAEALNARFAAVWSAAGSSESRRAALQGLRERYGLSEKGPSTLHFSYFTDLRLALFLFAAADELPLSFLPIFTRAANNPWGWIDESVLISLPLAGYLLAIVIASPFARSLARWRGRRTLLILAAIPTFAAQLGLYFATSVPEIIAARTVTGFGYALVTLACQDYVLETTRREDRDRSLGMFSTVIWGGIFCGTALGGVLADRLGRENVFLLSATLIVISALLILWFVTPTGTRETAARTAKPPILATMRNQRFAALVFGIAIPTGVVVQAFISYTVALTLDSLGASSADIGRTLMIYFLAIALVGPLAGRAAERGVPVPAIAMSGGFLAGVSLFAVAWWPSEITMICAVLGAGIGHGMVDGSKVSFAMSIAETELRYLGADPVLGALRTMERLGSIAGLLLIAAFAGQFGYAFATGAVATWSLAGAALFGLSIATNRLIQGRQTAG